MVKKLTLFISLLSLIFCKHPFLYEINTRPWLYELSLKYGKSITKLNEIPLEEFDYFREKSIPMLTLGDLILKAETAVIMALGNIIYEYNCNRQN